MVHSRFILHAHTCSVTVPFSSCYTLHDRITQQCYKVADLHYFKHSSCVLRGTILTTKLLLRKVSNYYILKAKAPTSKPFADICSIEESFLVLKSRPYLTSHMITTEKILKLKRHIVLNNKININSKRTTICIL